jgi:proteasome component ECM29
MLLYRLVCNESPISPTGLTDLTGELNSSNAEKIWPMLEQAIGGKTWDGKEKVLEAFVLFARTGSELWRKQPDVANRITEVGYFF